MTVQVPLPFNERFPKSEEGFPCYICPYLQPMPGVMYGIVLIPPEGSPYRSPAPALPGDPFSPAEAEARVLNEWPKLRSVMLSVRRAAERLGFTQEVADPPFASHGQRCLAMALVEYITRDIDSHSGGVWKMFDRNGQRLGTFDEDLNYIGK